VSNSPSNLNYLHVVLISKYFGERDGGSQRSMLTLLKNIQQKGHRVTAVANTLPASVPFSYRQMDSIDQIGKVLRELTPDIVFTQLSWSTETIDAASELGIPVVYFSRLGECIVQADHVVFNCEYWKQRYPEIAEKSSVLLPVIEGKSVENASFFNREFVMMVNPIELKGGQLLVEIAQAMPDVSFFAIGGWVDPAEDGVHLNRAKNIIHHPVVNNLNVYWGKTRTLIVPSLWHEPAARVNIEALSNGVPVVASHVGGIPEMVEDAALLINPSQDINAWVKALRQLEDENYWEKSSELGISRALDYIELQSYKVEAFLTKLPDLLAVKDSRESARLIIPQEHQAFAYLEKYVFDYNNCKFRE